MSCAPTEKPSGPVFLIIASLITVLLSFPLHFALTTILNRYGGLWPASHGFEDDIANDKQTTKEVDAAMSSKKFDDTGDDREFNTAELLRNSKRDSAFGTEIKNGIIQGTAVDLNTPADISQIAYAG